MFDRLQTPPRHVAPPLPRPPGDDRPGRCRRPAVLRHAPGQRPASSARNHKHCILLWMGGGPSQLDTWDLKPESDKNGGEFRPIDTSAPGVKISEHLPTVAQQMQAPEHHPLAEHQRGEPRPRHLPDAHRLPPNPTVVHPSFGSVCSFELGPKLGDDFPLPHFVSINRPGESAGFLGMSHAAVHRAATPTARSRTSSRPSTPRRMNRRVQMLGLVEDRFIGQDRGVAAKGHRDVYAKTFKMMNSSYTRAFKLDEEPDAGPRGLRQGLLRLGLPDGPPAGRRPASPSSRSASAAGTTTTTSSGPSASSASPSSTRGWARSSPTSTASACSTTPWSSGWASSAGPRGSTRTAAATTGRGAGRSSWAAAA